MKKRRTIIKSVIAISLICAVGVAALALGNHFLYVDPLNRPFNTKYLKEVASAEDFTELTLPDGAPAAVLKAFKAQDGADKDMLIILSVGEGWAGDPIQVLCSFKTDGALNRIFIYKVTANSYLGAAQQKKITDYLNGGGSAETDDITAVTGVTAKYSVDAITSAVKAAEEFLPRLYGRIEDTVEEQVKTAVKESGWTEDNGWDELVFLPYGGALPEGVKGVYEIKGGASDGNLLIITEITGRYTYGWFGVEFNLDMGAAAVKSVTLAKALYNDDIEGIPGSKGFPSENAAAVTEYFRSYDYNKYKDLSAAELYALYNNAEDYANGEFEDLSDYTGATYLQYTPASLLQAVRAGVLCAEQSGAALWAMRGTAA